MTKKWVYLFDDVAEVESQPGDRHDHQAERGGNGARNRSPLALVARAS